LPQNGATFEDVKALYQSLMKIQPEGYGIDKQYPDLIYIPETAHFDLRKQIISFVHDGKEEIIPLRTSCTYILPSGYKVRMKKQTGGTTWHLYGTNGNGSLCHKPSTVSGGGKSEISKSIVYSMIQGPIFIADFEKDMKTVEQILNRPFGDQFKEAQLHKRANRPILDSHRSIGSVIKLLTPSPDYTEEYNAWLQSIPPYMKEIVFVVKRFYRPEWKHLWKDHFNVDIINGNPGHELKFENRKLIANYLRVGREVDGSWRIFKVRQDFSAAEKLQVEDDITASITVPASALKGLNPTYSNPSVKLVHNCEYRLFQRPDDAVYRGYDIQAESDLSHPNTFLSNYQPLTVEEGEKIIEDGIGFDQYTQPVKELILNFMKDPQPAYFACPSYPRMIHGKPSKNPRYLQNRPDLINPKQKYLSELGARFFRRIPLDIPIHFAVNAVLSGRRNHGYDPKLGIPPLAVYNPIHYQELPELFMDFICSVTGKSPSTTGFGSEGALTKGPFNALWSIIDLNNALVSYILTGYAGFTSAAGTIGPNIRVDHDVSLLVPEIWCRMSIQEQDPNFMIAKGFLEKMEDFEYQGRKILASRLGYRITDGFVRYFLGRIFSSPSLVFNQEMLKPETQDIEMFVSGIENIVASQKRIAEYYFEDGSIQAACPPLKALLHIMVSGEYEGRGIEHPEIRKMFERNTLLVSSWYQDRLKAQQKHDIELWKRHLFHLEQVLSDRAQLAISRKLNLAVRFKKAKEQLYRVSSKKYLDDLIGTIGLDPAVGS
jgi:hypothetical protein